MNAKRSVGLVSALIACVVVATIARAASHDPTPITVPGSISAIPAAPDTSYAPLALSDTRVSARQALDAAEAWSGSTDSDVDPNARAVPAIVRVGQNPAVHAVNPALYDVKAWVVTINRDTISNGPENFPHYASHKLVVVIDALTGRFITAYNAGHEDRLP